jgi:hypothetical protein
MTSKRMYFGTQERMTWVKCPAFNPDISKVGWQSTSQYLNGGATVRRSSTAHKEYQLAWNLASSDDVATITDYADRVYGDGLIYFLDPFAMSKNVLPQYWATPRLAVDDAPVFNNSDVRPTLVDTAANTNDYPTKSAVYTFSSTDSFLSLWIPLPEGYTFHFGAHGSRVGTAAVRLVPDGATGSTTTLTNWFSNGSLEVDSAQWSVYNGGTATRDNGWASSGAWSRKHVKTVTTTQGHIVLAPVAGTGIVPGSTVTMAVDVMSTTSISVSVAARATYTGTPATLEGASFGAGGSTTLSLTAGVPQRGKITVTVPALQPTQSALVTIGLQINNNGGPVGTVVYADNASLHVGTTDGKYHDGSNTTVVTAAGQTVYAWTGTPFASPSTATTTVVAGTEPVLLSPTDTQRVNTSVSGVSGVTISFWGEGTLTLAGMIAQVLPTGTTPQSGGFISGRGHSGCRFNGSPSVQGYSAPQALDYQSMSATLIETGAWE